MLSSLSLSISLSHSVWHAFSEFRLVVQTESCADAAEGPEMRFANSSSSGIRISFARRAIRASRSPRSARAARLETPCNTVLYWSRVLMFLDVRQICRIVLVCFNPWSLPSLYVYVFSPCFAEFCQDSSGHPRWRTRRSEWFQSPLPDVQRRAVAETNQTTARERTRSQVARERPTSNKFQT